ncbi:hypothetical protein [Abditibacterium utsteinense]|nr:hypothetical protein [Abditibacterium utsteinense]
MKNILAATLSWIFVVPFASAIVYFFNHVFLESLGKIGKCTAIFLSLSCAVMLLGAIILADVHCFLKYPQR